MPLIRNIQPRKMVTARLARGGTIIAASPSTTSRMPSIKKAFQCSRTAALISDCSLVTSWGRVIASLPMPVTENDAMLTRYYRAGFGGGHRHGAQISIVPRRLTPAGRRRKAGGRAAQPVATEKIDGRGHH